MYHDVIRGLAMAMTATAIRFADDEREWIKAYAQAQGQSFSEFVRQAALARVEDAVDARLFREALAADDGVTFSLDEVMRMVEGGVAPEDI